MRRIAQSSIDVVSPQIHGTLEPMQRWFVGMVGLVLTLGCSASGPAQSPSSPERQIEEPAQQATPTEGANTPDEPTDRGEAKTIASPDTKADSKADTKADTRPGKAADKKQALSAAELAAIRSADMVGQDLGPADPTTAKGVVASFYAAARAGDRQAALALMTVSCQEHERTWDKSFTQAIFDRGKRPKSEGLRGEAVEGDRATVSVRAIFVDADGRDDREGMRFELIRDGDTWKITSIR